MKLTVIGGGGVRSIFLAKSLAQRAQALGIKELMFMDADERKLRVFGGLAAGAVQRLAPDVRFSLTSDPVEAMKDADYLITTIRVGGDDARVKDERIALARGVLGQETTGAAGFSYAMRSVPVLMEYCELVRKHAKPGAKVFNFTNPAGLVSQALRDAGYDFTYGICDAPSGMLAQFAQYHGASPADIQGECYGLNHLSFFTSVKLKGREILSDLILDPDAYSHTDMRFFEPELVRHIACIPNEYLYYYYYREQAVQHILDAGTTRGERIAEINKQMLDEMDGMDTKTNFDAALQVFEKWYAQREDNYMAAETGVKRDKLWTFDLYAPDTGGYAGVALRYIEIAEKSDSGSMILCVPNEGAIPGLADSDVVEITCDITKGGVTPHRFASVDERNMELIRRVKIYERLGARAILKRDHGAAVDCLMLHPLVNSWSLAKELIADYYEHNAQYL